MNNERNVKNIQGFDILKIVASTLIVFHHYQQVFKVEFSEINFYGGKFNFNYLVELFFMISGFLTMHTDNVKRGGYWYAFLNKLLRIYPMTTISCLFTLIVKSIRATDINALWNWKRLITNFLLIFKGWFVFDAKGISNPSWYLCVLIQCYIVYYIIRVVCKEKIRFKLVIDLLIIFVAILCRHFNLIWNGTHRGICAFFIGVVLCECKEKIPRCKIVCVINLMAGVGLLVLYSSQQRIIQTYILFPTLILSCICWTGKGKYERVMRLLGGASFEVYIWHYPLMAAEQMIIRLTGYEITRSHMTMICFTIFTWIYAYAMLKIVELPVNSAIHEIIKR